jgi:hypothetical protein
VNDYNANAADFAIPLIFQRQFNYGKFTRRKKYNNEIMNVKSVLGK